MVRYCDVLRILGIVIAFSFTGGTCGPTDPPNRPTTTTPTSTTTLSYQCSSAYPSGSCPSGETCITGECCSVEDACGSVCCEAGSVCVHDPSGNRKCAQKCKTSRECPGSAPCCTLQKESGYSDQFKPDGVCLAKDSGSQCLCGTGADCASNVCAPRLDQYSNPTGPYICGSDNCGPYAGCSGWLTSCPNGYCDLCVSPGRCFCARVCQNDTTCGGAKCLNATHSYGTCAHNQPACFPQ